MQNLTGFVNHCTLIAEYEASLVILLKFSYTPLHYFKSYYAKKTMITKITESNNETIILIIRKI